MGHRLKNRWPVIVSNTPYFSPDFWAFLFCPTQMIFGAVSFCSYDTPLSFQIPEAIVL